MSDTLLRQWMMLRHVPRQPRKIATSALADLLSDAGFAVSRRSIERDLMKLSSLFPLCCDDKHKPYGWSWLASAPGFEVRAMDVHTALAFRMAAAHLRALLPEVTRSYLNPHFERAKAVLDGLEENALSNWPDKVRVLPVGQALLPPVIAQDVLEHVQSGLLTEHCLRIVYRKRGDAEARTYVVHPQALVWRDAVGYLLCSLWNYDDIVQFVLHRMESVEIDDAPRRVVPGFNLDAEIASGSFDFLLAVAPIQLEAMFHAFAAVRMRETPIADNQELIDQPDGRVLLRATLADTVQLRTWLQSIGEFVEVIAPAGLRAHMAASARATAAAYAMV